MELITILIGYLGALATVSNITIGIYVLTIAFVFIVYFVARNGKDPSGDDKKKLFLTVVHWLLKLPSQDRANKELSKKLFQRYTIASTRLPDIPPKNNGKDWTVDDLKEFYKTQSNVWDEAVKKIPEADRALTYVERVIDRQINKVRGLLTFGGILIIAIKTLHPTDSADNLSQILISIANACVWTAVIICLRLFFVHLNLQLDRSDFAAEIDETVEVIRKRTILIQIAVGLSLISVFALALNALLKL